MLDIFHLLGHQNSLNRQRFPDVVPEVEPVRYMDPSSLCEKDFTIENYTALQFDEGASSQAYTALSFKDKSGLNENGTGPTYAVIEPESDGQYMSASAANKSSFNRNDQRMSASGPNQQKKEQPVSSYPVYQELEADDNEAKPDAVYCCPHTKGKGPDAGNLIEHTYAETVAEPLYHVLNDNESVRSTIRGSNVNKEKGVSDDGYLIPCQSVKLPKNLTQQQQQPVYSPTHYIQPNPVNQESLKSSRHGHLNSGKSRHGTPQPASRKQNSTNGVRESEKYQPITSENATYLAIMR